jgi:Co/Zn/Cd efflux system component
VADPIAALVLLYWLGGSARSVRGHGRDTAHVPAATITATTNSAHFRGVRVTFVARDHGHSHGVGGYSHAPASFGKAFAIGVILNTGYVVTEVIYGRLAHSVALVADAGHNRGRARASSRGVPVTLSRAHHPASTYGFRASSILAALVNAVVLLVTIGGIAWEAIRRLQQPSDVAGGIVIWVAAAGILVNGITASSSSPVARAI